MCIHWYIASDVDSMLAYSHCMHTLTTSSNSVVMYA